IFGQCFEPCDLRLGAWNSRLGTVRGSYSFTRGADDRLDELMVRVLVAAIHQLREPERPARPVVVAAVEIERTNWIVRRANRENADAAGRGRRVAHHGGFR